MARRGQYGIDDWAETVRRTLSELGQKKKGSAPTTTRTVRNVGMSPAGKRRARSVGVSSSSRHRSRVAQRNRRR